MTSLWGKGDTRTLNRSALLFCAASATFSCVNYLCASCSSDSVRQRKEAVLHTELVEAGLADSETSNKVWQTNQLLKVFRPPRTFVNQKTRDRDTVLKRMYHRLKNCETIHAMVKAWNSYTVSFSHSILPLCHHCPLTEKLIK